MSSSRWSWAIGLKYTSIYFMCSVSLLLLEDSQSVSQTFCWTCTRGFFFRSTEFSCCLFQFSKTPSGGNLLVLSTLFHAFALILPMYDSLSNDEHIYGIVNPSTTLSALRGYNKYLRQNSWYFLSAVFTSIIKYSSVVPALFVASRQKNVFVCLCQAKF